MKKYLLYSLISGMKNSFGNHVFSLTIAMLIVSCKLDTNEITINPDASDIEKNYFKDYDSPKHKWGFIDINGSVKVEPQYDDLKDYVNGRSAANLAGRWGYLNENGNKIIEFKYKQAYDFSEDGYALVQDFNNNWLVIDLGGKLISEMSLSEVSEVRHGYIVIGAQGQKGILTVSGVQIINPSFLSIKILSSSHFIGRNSSGEAVYNFNGEKISEVYDKIYFPNGSFLRAKNDDLYYFLQEGDYRASNSLGYQSAQDFNNDYTLVKKASSFELVNKDFTTIKILDYKDVRSAGDGYWKYRQDKNWGLLSPKGEKITSDQYQLLNRFSDNRIAYSNNSRWGYLNKAGESVIGGNLALVWDFHDGRARMIGNRGVGFIDTTGRMVIKDRFFEVREFYNGLSRFQTF